MNVLFLSSWYPTEKIKLWRLCKGTCPFGKAGWQPNCCYRSGFKEKQKDISFQKNGLPG